ncbi:uncharacterized protein B0P05DRAFT_592546 [Gilbertella persicaria]|uniref:uncharacterized protein n=1 Tax=Gilbertella persicaria TaxID=101096 RepID=UPI00221E4AAE|nr:uncharacterized protein B0P05DRAFT_592546 [Gilbertella persicaria]KAI8047671.1 hypothetical protein B0P05DRAFT_592546 [Gilbertella persicaria]
MKAAKTVRIHINTNDQPRPVIFNYRQLYKRELKRQESHEDLPPLNTPDDLFYQELLKKAENYAMDEEEDDDNDDDEENATESKKQVGNDYDFEDPFIDDSEMLLDEPQEYSVPEFDGFFVYHGPLDGHDGHEGEKKTTTTTKRKAPAKSKPSISSSAASHKKPTTSITPSTTNTMATPTTPTTTITTITTTTTTNTTATPSSHPATDKRKKTDEQDENKKTKPVKKPSASQPAKTEAKLKPSTSTSSSSAPLKKVASVTEQPPKKKKKVENKEEPSEPVDKKKKSNVSLELKPLDPEIEALMDKLRHDVQFETFENKAKFPLTLKPTVLEAGLVALRKHKTIDENLVQHLMKILPYNRFTLKKFLTTKSGQMRVDELQQEIDELAILLKHTIDRMMPEQQRLFHEKLAQSQEPSKPEEEESTPTPKFKCNDEVRKILYDIIQTEEQSIHIANQVALHKDPEKKQEGLASDGKARKLMYQRLLSCWPEGWMNSYEMSRQYSQYKSKLAQASDKKTVSVDKKRKRAEETPRCKLG